MVALKVTRSTTAATKRGSGSGVDPAAGGEGGDLGGADGGDGVGVEVGEPLEAGEPGFGDPAGAATAVPVVELGGENLGEVAEVGVPFPGGDVGEAGGFGSDGGQAELAGGGPDGGVGGGVGDRGYDALLVSRSSYPVRVGAGRL
jgi:hypothetical protein